MPEAGPQGRGGAAGRPAGPPRPPPPPPAGRRRGAPHAHRKILRFVDHGFVEYLGENRFSRDRETLTVGGVHAVAFSDEAGKQIPHPFGVILRQVGIASRARKPEGVIKDGFAFLCHVHAFPLFQLISLVCCSLF